MSGFNVEDLAIDLFYWFDKSTKRKALLSEYCNFCDVQYRDIIKHVNTRWLSLEKAIYRVPQQYDALKSYFISQGMLLEYTVPIYIFACLSLFLIDDKAPRFHRIHSAFMNPMTEIILLFYEAVLPTFVNFNKFLQREEPLVHVLHCQIQSFLTKLASKFVLVRNIKSVSDYSALKYTDERDQLPGMLLFLQ